MAPRTAKTKRTTRALPCESCAERVVERDDALLQLAIAREELNALGLEARAAAAFPPPPREHLREALLDVGRLMKDRLERVDTSGRVRALLETVKSRARG